MSYDLYLSSPRLDDDAFARYFEGRPHYDETGWYCNEDTGVYFSFAVEDPDEDDDEDEVDPELPEILHGRHVAFNLNFFRPHVFGLEAAPEVAAFIDGFDCTLFDPQIDGIVDGPFSAEGFLRGWNKGNLAGYRALGEEGIADDMLVANDVLIEAVWRWNLNRAASQQVIGENRFLPRLYWAKNLSEGSPIAFALWSEGVASAFPECATHVLLGREPRRRFASLFGAKKSDLETKLMPIEDIAALTGCAWQETAVGRLLLAPAEFPPSKAIAAAFNAPFEGMDMVAKPFATDHVLNASLMAKAKG